MTDFADIIKEKNLITQDNLLSDEIILLMNNKTIFDIAKFIADTFGNLLEIRIVDQYDPVHKLEKRYYIMNSVTNMDTFHFLLKKLFYRNFINLLIELQKITENEELNIFILNLKKCNDEFINKLINIMEIHLFPQKKLNK